ncbi:Hypothetical predicted protein [Paramuricea clavata]|uniref:Uncharacterized protein n=1 Tax=Paramuricea clavata TaxID=317549 RepID=A0A6S7GIK0_PARCT|nr:Hypothetical predicted protein [Paramuricea clavata]
MSVYSSRSSLSMSAWSRDSHDGREEESRELRSLNSTALSQYSQHTMYSHPVPGSITSSDPHQDQLKRSDREYVFVQRPFVTPLPLVNSWLRNNFFGSHHRASNRASLGSDPGISMIDQVTWITRGTSITTPRDPCYLINNQKTEVVLCGIPGDSTQDYPMLEMVRYRTRGSMIELHRKPQWTFSTARMRSAEMCRYMSLPNISAEFGLKNRIAFNVQVLESLTSMTSHLHHHQDSSIEEKDDSFVDNFDSISVVLQKVEKRDQALRDAARAKMEENRTRRARRLRLFREQEETEATRPVPPQVTRSSFIDILKKETYEQVFVPLLFHVGKEIVAHMAVFI